MEQAMIKLIGCLTYSWRNYFFKQNVPQYVRGKEAIDYFLSQDAFSVRPVSGPPTQPKVVKKVEAPVVPVIEEKPVEVKPVEVKPVEAKPKKRMIKKVAKKRKKATTT